MISELITKINGDDFEIDLYYYLNFMSVKMIMDQLKPLTKIRKLHALARKDEYFGYKVALLK